MVFRSKVERLMDVLGRERGALLYGDFQDIEKVSQEKYKALADMDFLSTSSEVRQSVVKSIERNQKLLSSAIRGAKSAIQQLDLSSGKKVKSAIYTAWGTKAVMCGAEIGGSKKY